MSRQGIRTGGELFIVDNTDDDWKVHRYLHDWCEISRAFDIATAYFDIGSLLALDGQWQKLEQIRILMGDEVSRRTKKAFQDGLAEVTAKLDDSIEEAKEADDFLSGVRTSFAIAMLCSKALATAAATQSFCRSISHVCP